MANNRLQIYCQRCLEMKALAKYYPVDWSMPENMWAEINLFLDAHKECFEKQPELGTGEKLIKFRTEMDDDGLISDYSQRPFRVTPLTN